MAAQWSQSSWIVNQPTFFVGGMPAFSRQYGLYYACDSYHICWGAVQGRPVVPEFMDCESTDFFLLAVCFSLAGNTALTKRVDRAHGFQIRFCILRLL